MGETTAPLTTSVRFLVVGLTTYLADRLVNQYTFTLAGPAELAQPRRRRAQWRRR